MLHSRGAWLCQRCRCYCQSSLSHFKSPNLRNREDQNNTFWAIAFLQLPGGAVLKNSNILLEVCIVKGTAATLCHRFAGLSTAKLIRYRNKNKFFSPFSFRFQGFFRVYQGPDWKRGKKRRNCGGAWGREAMAIPAHIYYICVADMEVARREMMS